MQRELGAWQYPSPRHEWHALTGYVCPNKHPHGGKIQKRARIDNGPVWHFGR